MHTSFVGRRQELEKLTRLLTRVEANGRGILLSIRGRRQVGKSRLVEEFLHRAQVKSLFFAASKGARPGEERRRFVQELRVSGALDSSLLDSIAFADWGALLRFLATHTTQPTVVVLDELPYLMAGDPALEGALQQIWDRHLSRKPVLMIVIGSDLSLMELLGQYDRPLYQRMQEAVIAPFGVSEVAQMLALRADDAFDATIVSGGFPRLCEEWSPGMNLQRFVEQQLADSTSPLVVVGERILSAEFPATLQARVVLEAIGSGETTFSRIQGRAGLKQGAVERSLRLLTHKGVIRVVRPLCAHRVKNITRYYVADPYLRFWLRFVGPQMELLLRGRGDLACARIWQQWSDYRGRAIEPLVRASLEQLLPEERFGEATHVGSYWTRASDLEVDLVGATGPQGPTTVEFVGSIKWRGRKAFSPQDLAELSRGRHGVPGAEHARLVAVSRSGFHVAGLDVALSPDDLLLGCAAGPPPLAPPT